MSYPDSLEIQPLTKPPQAAIHVPGSKSITNRALVLAALRAKGYAYALRGALQSEDTEVMVECLRTLGFRVLTKWDEDAIFVSSEEGTPTIPVADAELFVANSGTTMRFLTAMVCLGHGWYRLSGVKRMHERPIEDLLAALRQFGVKAYSENENGCPPVIVQAHGLPGRKVRIRGEISSQFLSGLMMAAMRADGTVDIEIEGSLVSKPYVRMTALMIEQFGGGVRDESPERITVLGVPTQTIERLKAAPFPDPVPQSGTPLKEYPVEPDASAASYYWASAALTNGDVSVTGISYPGLQGDVRFADVLETMGCEVSRNKHDITVRGRALHGIDIDMNDISDTVMTLAAVACFAEGPTTIRNVAHIRHKETDRLTALCTELRKVGAEVEEFPDGLKITPRPLHGAVIETYNDHRMAMSMALIGLKVPGIVIKNPGCVAKTYPGFWQDLEKLRS